MPHRLIQALAVDISPLKESPAYRALWLGQIVSLIGSQMRIVAVSWQVFQITGSSVAVGVVGLVEVIPLISFSIVAGAIADRADRRRIMALSQVGMLVASGLLAAISFGGSPSVMWVYALTGIASGVSSFDRPARTAVLPTLVGPGKVSAALTLRQVGFQVTQIVGAGVGGLLVAALGVAWVYAIDALTFLAALAALRRVPSLRPVDAEDQSGIRAVKEGLRFTFTSPLIVSIFAIDLIAMIFGMPRAVFPELADQTFERGAAVLGLLYAAPSIGALIAALTSGWVQTVQRQGVAVILAVMLWGACITLAGLSLFSLALTLLFLAVAGGADVISAVFRGTMLQESTPDSLRGRVSALNIVVVTGGPRLGDFEAGLVAGAVGPQGSIVLGGLACLGGTGLLALLAPLRAYRAPAPRGRTAAVPEAKEGVAATGGSG